jgi:hypothetical protein
VAVAILMELNIRLTVLVVETARLERRGVNDNEFQQMIIVSRMSLLMLLSFLILKLSTR